MTERSEGKNPEQILSAETQDRWETLKQGPPALAILEGRKMGMPEEELDRFAREVIAQRSEEGDLHFVFRFMANLAIGTAEERQKIGQEAYRFSLEVGDWASAKNLAEAVYGEDSEEWKIAQKKVDERQQRLKKERLKDEAEDQRIVLPRDATVADLFTAISTFEEKEGPGESHFEEELYDNFDPEIADELIDLESDPTTAAKIKLVDFFKDRGHEPTDLTAYLPIDFN
jgi:hypothetical protein